MHPSPYSFPIKKCNFSGDLSLPNISSTPVTSNRSCAPPSFHCKSMCGQEHTSLDALPRHNPTTCSQSCSYSLTQRKLRTPQFLILSISIESDISPLPIAEFHNQTFFQRGQPVHHGESNFQTVIPIPHIIPK